jgi:hypothetical protein
MNSVCGSYLPTREQGNEGESATMPDSELHDTGLSSQYTAQVASDLERNTKEQERLTAEIDALQQQLTALKRDHDLLVSMQQALGIASLPAQQTTAPDAPAAPTSRKRGGTTTARASNKTRAKKTTTATKRSATRKSAVKESPQTASSTKQAQPTLVELVRGHLTEQKEPRSAAEISTALSQAHPERGIKTTVVRTTLEGLVAKNQAQRTKQGSSVYYTGPEGQEPAEPSAQTDEKQATSS